MTDTATAAPVTLGVIEVAGADAAAFLRAQLTNDVARLGPDRHFLAGWCDPKGRTLLIARVAEVDERYLLVVAAESIAPILKRLRMFVLRAQVELADVSAAYRISGLSGDGLPLANRVEHRGPHVLLGLPCASDTSARALMLTPAGVAVPETAVAADHPAWALADIDAGVPAICEATQGLFVPQMLNLHWLMALDFDKGCYPGQEVIARLHYRGRLTRRLYRLAWRGSPPVPGADIFDSDGARQGTVLQAAGSHGAGRLLAVVAVKASPHYLSCSDAGLEMLELPYATPG